MTPILELEDLHYCYPGRDEPALRGATVSIEPGRKVALLGRNGSGKSTLLLQCNGILRPDRGVVRLAGKTLGYSRPEVKEMRRQVGIVFQNPDDQLFSASVAQDISFGPLNLGLNQEETRRRVAEAAELCEIADLLDRPTHALSGGQKTRVALAGVLAMEPLVLIGDEVTASLDPWMRQQVYRIFNRLVEAGRTVVIATHEVEIAHYWADLVVVMQAGRVIATDRPERIFGDETLLSLVCPSTPWG